MKITFIVLLIVVGVLTGCMSSDPIHPNNNQTNSRKVLTGRVSQFSYFLKSSNLIWDNRQADVNVDVIGTQISAKTNGYGEFEIQGLDSGSYSLRFSKIGYETIQLDNILSNGIDSIVIKNVLIDTNGLKQIYEEVFLSELVPTIQVLNANAIAKEVIWADTLGGNIIHYDTAYSWEASFSVNLQSNIKETQDSLAAGFLVRITNRNTIATNEQPSAFYANIELTNGWLGFYGHSYLTKPIYIGTRNFTITQNTSKGDVSIPLGYFSKTSNYQVKKTEQLYLHIIPVVKELKRVQHSNRFNTWFTFDVQYKFGELQTIPIAWK